MSDEHRRSDSTPSSASPGVFLKLAHAAHKEGFLDPDTLANLSPASRESLSSLSDVSHEAMCEPYGCGVFVAGSRARARGRATPQMFQIAKWPPDSEKLSMRCAALTRGKVCARERVELASARTVVELLLDVRRQSRESLGYLLPSYIYNEIYTMHTDPGSSVQITLHRSHSHTFVVRVRGARLSGEELPPFSSGIFTQNGADLNWDIQRVGDRFDASVRVLAPDPGTMSRALADAAGVIRSVDNNRSPNEHVFERLFANIARDVLPERGKERSLEAVQMELYMDSGSTTLPILNDAQRDRRWMSVPDGTNWALVAIVSGALVFVS